MLMAACSADADVDLAQIGDDSTQSDGDATPEPESTPEPTEAPVSNSERDDAISFMSEEAVVTEEQAACVADETFERTGIYNPEDAENADRDEPFRFGQVIAACGLEDLIVNDDVLSLIPDGYTDTEARCIALALFANVGADRSIDQEVWRGDEARKCAVPLGPEEGAPPPGTAPERDGLWVACSEGSGLACAQLYSFSEAGSEYEQFGESCGGRVIGVSCEMYLDGEISVFSPTGLPDLDDVADAGSPAPGDDPALDELWVACGAGDGAACDELYFAAPSGSEYEDFGFTCGGREIVDCETLLDTEPLDLTAIAGLALPGADSALDELWVACAGGDGEACDDLYIKSPIDSDYEVFGFTCGGRTADEECTELLPGDN